MTARGVIRDVGRVLSIPYGEVDKIATEALEKRAKDASERIADMWVSLTKTKIKQTEAWLAKEKAILKDSMVANKNYKRDLQRLEEIAIAKNDKIALEKIEKDMQVIEAKIAAQKKLTKEIIASEEQSTAESVRLQNAEFEAFSQMMEDRAQGKDIDRDRDKARRDGDFEAFVATLSNEKLAFQQNIADRKMLFDQYQKYRVIQDKNFISDFDKEIMRITGKDNDC